MVLDKRGADSQAFLLGPTGDQTDGRDTIIHQFKCQLPGGHTGIADGEVESVGNRFIEIFVVNHLEIVAAKNLLQLPGTLTIDSDLLTEIVTALVGSFQHGSQSILCTMTGT